MFYAWCFFLATRDLRDARAAWREMLHDGQYLAEFYNAGSKFWETHPQKISGAKNMQNLARFRTTSKFGANISETDEGIQNRIVIPSMAIRPALGETSTVKFGPVTLEISMWNRTPLKRIFRKTIFRPLGGAAPPNFYTR